MPELSDEHFAVLTAEDVAMLERAASPGVAYLDDYDFEDDDAVTVVRSVSAAEDDFGWDAADE